MIKIFNEPQDAKIKVVIYITQPALGFVCDGEVHVDIKTHEETEDCDCLDKHDPKRGRLYLMICHPVEDNVQNVSDDEGEIKHG